MEERYDIIIIGGGISGLSLANFLAQMDRKVLILEKQNRVGGVIESLCLEDFSVDLSTHAAYNSYTTLLELVENNSFSACLQMREKKGYYFAGKKGFEKLIRKINIPILICHIRNFFSETKQGKSVQEYFSKIIGKKNYQSFGQHFFKAILCQEPSGYPAAFFLKKRSSRNKDFPKSFTFKKGMQSFTEKLAAHKNICIQTDVKLEKILKNESGFEAQTSKGSYTAKDIAFATYAPETARYLREFAHELASCLENITYKAVSSLGIITEKNKTAHVKEFAGLLTQSDSFTSIVSRDIAPHKDFRGFTIHTQGKVEGEKLEENLCDTLGIFSENILAKSYKNSFLPELKKGHEDLLFELESLISENENIYITGNYFRGLSLEDCIARSKEEALRYISSQK